jgi:hypothetical protein
MSSDEDNYQIIQDSVYVLIFRSSPPQTSCFAKGSNPQNYSDSATSDPGARMLV